jgi:hypothetical protein
LRFFSYYLFLFSDLGEEGIHSPPSRNGDGGEVKIVGYYILADSRCERFHKTEKSVSVPMSFRYKYITIDA